MHGAQSAGNEKTGTSAFSLPQTTYVVNPNGNILYLDEKLSRMLGYSQEELLGEHYSRIVDTSRNPRNVSRPSTCCIRAPRFPVRSVRSDAIAFPTNANGRRMLLPTHNAAGGSGSPCSRRRSISSSEK